MRIRHIVAIDNIDQQGCVIDPLLVRHGIVLAGQIGDLAGPIDPLTHLNRDFHQHRLEECLVAERLERGATLLRDGDRFQIASVRTNAYTSLGPVDVDRRRADWQRAVGS
ncbi:MAG: hypothetical protein ABIV47_28765 [Roseiflexaceae bacterium]